MRIQPQFKLQFNPSEIEAFANRYRFADDTDALEAGTLLLGGDCGVENLKRIVRWKSARRIGLIAKNDTSTLASTLKYATSQDVTVKAAIEALDELHGVGIPMASAILAMARPEVYTIIDFRALEALGVTKWPKTSAYYEAYLGTCRELSKQHKKTLRTLDRALWQWSKERGRMRHRECE
jgi:endonuclease III